MNLSRYSAIVFGSNNAKYQTASIDAITNYIKNGGGALFISMRISARAGGMRRIPTRRFSPVRPESAQDNGVYALTRAGGDFAKPTHPVLFGVDSFDGEGVSPLVVPRRHRRVCASSESSARERRRATTMEPARATSSRARCGT
jgi:hypothetical protein